nr:MAG TPA: hypothetical protein [Caudoviricetes sp.]
MQSITPKTAINIGRKRLAAPKGRFLPVFLFCPN